MNGDQCFPIIRTALSHSHTKPRDIALLKITGISMNSIKYEALLYGFIVVASYNYKETLIKSPMCYCIQLAKGFAYS